MKFLFYQHEPFETTCPSQQSLKLLSYMNRSSQHCRPLPSKFAWNGDLNIICVQKPCIIDKQLCKHSVVQNLYRCLPVRINTTALVFSITSWWWLNTGQAILSLVESSKLRVLVNPFVFLRADFQIGCKGFVTLAKILLARSLGVN